MYLFVWHPQASLAHHHGRHWARAFLSLITVSLHLRNSIFSPFYPSFALDRNLSRTFRDAAIWTLWSPVEFGRSMCWSPLFWSFFLIFQAFFLCRFVGRSALCRPSGPLQLVSFCNYFNKAQCSYFYVLYVPPRKAGREELGIGQRIAIYDDVARVNITWKGNEWGIHILTHYQYACHHKCQAGHGGTSGHPSDETNTDMFLHIKTRWATGILVTAYLINVFHARQRLPFYNISE